MSEVADLMFEKTHTQECELNYEEQRAQQIREIENLWREKTGKDLKAFDAAINKRFEVKDGRNALTFASIKTVKDGLLKHKEKTKGEKK